MAPTAPNLTLDEPNGSITPHLLIWAAQFAALLSPNFAYRKHVFGALIIGLAVWGNIHPHFTNDPDSAQPYTLAWAFYLSTLEKLVHSDARGPEASYWHLGKPKEALKYSALGFRKLKWAFGLIFGIRGVRWNWQVKNTPTSPRTDRVRFVVTQILLLAYHMLVADLLITLGIRMWYSSPEGRIGQVNSKFLTLRHEDWSQQFLRCLVWGSLPYHAIQMQYFACAVVGVMFGLSSPEDWPPFFGRLRDVTTVRDFWGSFWHQTIRKMINGFTGSAVDLLRIKRGTNLSSYTQLWLGFAISGVMHALSMRMLPSPVNITLEEKTVGMLQFFMWQAAAITFEDFIQWVWGRVVGPRQGSDPLRTAVGYVWVVASFWYSIPFAADVMLRLRCVETSPLPIAVFGPLLLET